MKYLAVCAAFGLFLMTACRPTLDDLSSILESTIVSGDPAATSASTPQITETSPPTPVPSATPTSTSTPTPTPSPTPLSVADLFDQLSASVARISTGGRIGSGVLLEDGYVLTNAHVVWPDDSAIITFPDGDEFEDVPIADVDLLADLALLGPIETDLTPVVFEDAEDLRVGSDVLLIGYPGDFSRSPRPTLTETLLSRKREQSQMGLTLFQVSSPVAGGQSGGIALLPDGKVIGLTGNRITEAQFGLVTSGADIAPRIERMLSEEGVGSPNRGADETEADTRHVFSIKGSTGPQKIFMSDVTAGSEFEVTIDSSSNAALFITSPTLADMMLVDETTYGKEHISLEALESGVHYVIALKGPSSQGVFTLTSNLPLTPYRDPDDNQMLSLGDVYEGVIDFPGDVDGFSLFLTEGEEINITASSLMIDPLLTIYPAEYEEEYAVYDNDSGDGVIGTEAEVTYKAPHTGAYKLAITDASIVNGAGGYIVSLQEPYEGAPTPVSPKPTPEPIDSDFGDMKLYESDVFSFSIQYPRAYTNQSNTFDCEAYTACFADTTDPDFNFLAISEGEIGGPGAAQTLDEVAERMKTLGATVVEGIEWVGSEEWMTAQGDRAIVLNFSAPDGSIRFKVFTTSPNDKNIFSVMYFYSDPEMEPLINFIFNSYQR
ncbi:MAG: serine protease [Chloroflexota bacterium]